MITTVFSIWVTMGVVAYIINHRNKVARWNFYEWHDLNGLIPIPENAKKIRDNDIARNTLYCVMFILFVLTGPLMFYRTLQNII